MELYHKKRRWNTFLVVVALFIGVASFHYTNWLAQNMAAEEQRSVAMWAEATRLLTTPSPNADENLAFLLNILESNTDIPIIFTDSQRHIINSANIGYPENRKEPVLSRELRKMIEEKAPIEIVVSETEKQYIYYRDSRILQNLKYFPLIQISVISVFAFFAYLMFNASKKAEQNQVWVGMSKETAHQLGTPISSLMAWVELLRAQDINPELIAEFEKDINRLERITERFSKIGSKPELLSEDLRKTVVSSITYLQSRTSQKVHYKMEFPENMSYVTPHNPALISWVIENLCKNAIDAMGNSGKITLSLQQTDAQILFDIADNGKGIPKSQFKTIFEPGFTTKARGWGLGLSLAKRIIENYHRGKIFIKHSELGKGTTFRIVLQKSDFFNTHTPT